MAQATLDENKLEMLPFTKFGGNKIAAHDGKIGCNTVKYTTVFLYTDCLYFLRHGMK